MRERERVIRTTLSAAVLAAAVVAPAGLAVGEDQTVVVTAEGQEFRGAVTLVDDGRVRVKPEGDAPAKVLPFADLNRVHFKPSVRPGRTDLLVVDNDGQHAQQTESGSIKLGAGLHRVTIVYWQGGGTKALDLEWSGPGFSRRVVPSSAFFHVPSGQDPGESGGLDAGGFRQPENPKDARRRLEYEYHVAEGSRSWSSAGEALGEMKKVRTGTTDRVDLRVVDREEGFGLIFTGYIRAPKAGDYTFHLSSDDGSQLYIGRPPGLLSNNKVTGRRTWEAELAGGGYIAGEIDAIDGEAVSIDSPGPDKQIRLDVPLTHVRVLWSASGREDREGLDVGLAAKTGEDIVFVALSAEDAPGDVDRTIVRRVGGKVLGVEDEEDGRVLRFAYRGQARSIKLDKVIGIAFGARRDGPAVDPDPGLHQSLHLMGGQRLHGRWVSLDDKTLGFDTPWGKRLDAPRKAVVQVRVENGRLVDLTELEPIRVEQVPYFDRVIRHRINQALAGGPIIVFGAGRFETGISAAPRCRLTYALERGYERLSTTPGLLDPGGRLGNVTFRVYGDGKVLAERENVTGSDKVQRLDVDITGVDELTLEVDFGEGQDVGDRAVWAEPTLLRGGGDG